MVVGLRHRIAVAAAIPGAGLVAQSNRTVGGFAMALQPADESGSEVKIDRFVIVMNPNDVPVHRMGVRVGVVTFAEDAFVPIGEGRRAWLRRNQAGPRTFPRRLIKMAVYNYVAWLFHR